MGILSRGTGRPDYMTTVGTGTGSGNYTSTMAADIIAVTAGTVDVRGNINIASGSVIVTSGAISVTNTATIAITGTPNVNIANTGTVVIGGSGSTISVNIANTGTVAIAGGNVSITTGSVVISSSIVMQSGVVTSGTIYTKRGFTGFFGIATGTIAAATTGTVYFVPQLGANESFHIKEYSVTSDATTLRQVNAFLSATSSVSLDNWYTHNGVINSFGIELGVSIPNNGTLAILVRNMDSVAHSYAVFTECTSTTTSTLVVAIAGFTGGTTGGGGGGGGVGILGA